MALFPCLGESGGTGPEIGVFTLSSYAGASHTITLGRRPKFYYQIVENGGAESVLYDERISTTQYRALFGTSSNGGLKIANLNTNCIGYGNGTIKLNVTDTGITFTAIDWATVLVNKPVYYVLF